MRVARLASCLFLSVSGAAVSTATGDRAMAVYNSKDKLAYFKDNKQTHESPVRDRQLWALPLVLMRG
jgi:hypothetical protein